MLSLDLKHIFKARGIDKPYTYLVKAGFTPHTASLLCTNSTKVFKLKHIELLCKVLVCEPNDLLSYKATNKDHLPPNHPLLKLQHEEVDQNWRQTLATIPFNKLKELTQKIKNGE